MTLKSRGIAPPHSSYQGRGHRERSQGARERGSRFSRRCRGLLPRCGRCRPRLHSILKLYEHNFATLVLRASLGAIGGACACRSPPRTKPRYASLVPKGSLIETLGILLPQCSYPLWGIPNAKCSKDLLFQQLPLAFNLRVFRVDVAHFLKVVYSSLYGAFTYTQIVREP